MKKHRPVYLVIDSEVAPATIFLVTDDHERADSAARNISGQVAELPIIADYRTHGRRLTSVPPPYVPGARTGIGDEPPPDDEPPARECCGQPGCGAC